MSSIELEFARIVDEELNRITKRNDEFVRIYSRVIFERNSEPLEPILALVDTGAFISLLPQFIWEDIDINFIGDYHVRGIIKKRECSIDVKVGITKCRLTDRFGHTSEPFEALVYCAYTNEVPAIIGLKDIMERFSICINIENNRGELNEIR